MFVSSVLVSFLKLCNDGVMLCGRDEDAQIKLFTNRLTRSEFEDCSGINDEITAYVANPNDNVVSFVN